MRRSLLMIALLVLSVCAFAHDNDDAGGSTPAPVPVVTPSPIPHPAPITLPTQQTIMNYYNAPGTAGSIAMGMISADWHSYKHPYLGVGIGHFRDNTGIALGVSGKFCDSCGLFSGKVAYEYDPNPPPGQPNNYVMYGLGYVVRR